MVVSALLLFAMQSSHLRKLTTTSFDASYFARKWHGREVSSNGLRQRARLEDFAAPESVILASGTTMAEDDRLQRIFEPFWVSKVRDKQTAVFDRSLSIPGDVQDCSAILSADDEYTLLVNGKQEASGHDLQYVNKEFRIGAYVHPGVNEIEIQAKNWFGPAFVRCRIDVVTSLPVRADPSSWKCRASGNVGPWSIPEIVKSPVFKDEKGAPIWMRSKSNGVQAVDFERSIFVDGIPRKCSVLLGADNAWDLTVNGLPIAREGMTENPAAPRTVDVGSAMRPGKNAIHVKVWNYGGPGALFCVPTIEYSA